MLSLLAHLSAAALILAAAAALGSARGLLAVVREESLATMRAGVTLSPVANLAHRLVAGVDVNGRHDYRA